MLASCDRAAGTLSDLVGTLFTTQVNSGEQVCLVVYNAESVASGPDLHELRQSYSIASICCVLLRFLPARLGLIQVCPFKVVILSPSAVHSI